MKKRKLKRIWIIILLVLIIILSFPIITITRIHSKNYSIKSSIVLFRYDLKDFVLKNDYSKTLDFVNSDKDFKKENVKYYIQINYYKDQNFLQNVNKFLTLGYSPNIINTIYEKLEFEDVEILSNKNNIKDITNYLEFDFFKIQNIDRYINYFTGNYKNTIVNVNIGLDKKQYEEAVTTENFNEQMIVNKYNKLEKAYKPKDITNIKSSCSKGQQSLSKIAKDAFENMCEQALKDGKNILANSAYRDYSYQENLYNTYLKLYGTTYVKNYVALPGFSEHQTGLAVDVAAKGHNIFKNSPEYKWMKENAYKFGFILRYPEGKEKITGYKSEAWHFRYVGIDIATFIQENNITFDEYYAMYLY